jgi:hypothetical protein
MKIPQIQARLTELSKELRCPEIASLAGELSRRKLVIKAPNHSTPMSNDIRVAIRNAHVDNPELPLNRIAAMFDVNPGRVSETLRGFRT